MVPGKMPASGGGRPTELRRPWSGGTASPERTKVWMEPKPPKVSAERRKVPVIYYLTRNGHLEHPHFMEVTLSSSDGLSLRDVIGRLNCLRGKGIAAMYAWSSKRSYKNGYVWHDLSEDDIIHPVHGTEYVLKGSELLQGGAATTAAASSSRATSATSSGSDKSLDFSDSVAGGDSQFLLGRKKKPWHSLELAEYKVYKTESTAEAAVKAADASTQTDERRQWRRTMHRDEQSSSIPDPEELSRDEISPPPSSSSPDTLETLIRADVIAAGDGGAAAQDPDRATGVHSSGRTRASQVLMHLISCGSFSVKDHGFSLVSQYRTRLPRRRALEAAVRGIKDDERPVDGRPSFPALSMEDKEYFSGSLIEMKKEVKDGEPPHLKRSSSFNDERVLKLELEGGEEADGARGKCLPRRAARLTRKEMAGNRGSVSDRRDL